MKSSSIHRRSRKPPSTPDKDQPFFPSARHAPQQPFFNSTSGAVPQAKLTISDPNSAFEQEADAMAKSVVSRPNAAEVTPQNSAQVQRQSMEEEPQAKLMRMEEEELQAKPELMRMEEEELQAKLMRMEEDEPQAKLMRIEEEEPQAKAEPSKSPAKPNLSQRLQHTKGQGQPLPAKTQKEMGHIFKYDFSNVTVHTGLAAVQMTRDAKAQAFTYGQDIYFNEGKYSPNSSTGKELLAHELTHVVQQNPK